MRSDFDMVTFLISLSLVIVCLAVAPFIFTVFVYGIKSVINVIETPYPLMQNASYNLF